MRRGRGERMWRNNKTQGEDEEERVWERRGQIKRRMERWRVDGVRRGKQEFLW